MAQFTKKQVERAAGLARQFVAAHERRRTDYNGVTLNERETLYVLYGALAAMVSQEGVKVA